MTETKQVKLSKLFRGGRFVGHALSVDAPDIHLKS
ncbi:Uncharacterised protein [Providencia rustigianii]|uniref:Uncharacterized protein n=1 Tax=Providencia rustigianii TaxID=158850 RepID=A0A379G4F4_9GAMM|nr:Uncharacterised protein [Providencia rustigianii]